MRSTSILLWTCGPVLAVAAALAACGGGSSPVSGGTAATGASVIAESEEDFPADASATHYHPIHHEAFGPIWGSGCPDNGACRCGESKNLAEEFTCQMDRLQANDIPVTAYLFDGASWSKASSGETNSCTGADCCSWNLGDSVIQRLSRTGARGLLHFWGGCHEPEQYLRASSRLGRSLFGFYLDDGSSDDELAGVSEFMQSADPGDWECVAKAFQNREPSTSNTGLSKWANVAYVGDLDPDFDGMKTAIARVLEKAPYIPAPYAELTGYGYGSESIPTTEVYYRRLHFGALQPVMAHTPYANTDPWRPEYPSDLVRTYRYWAWLHRELVPYFYSLAYRMFEQPNRPLLRRGPMTDSFRVGDTVYAPFVTQTTRAMDVTLPGGSWVYYWDESVLATGSVAKLPVPLGGEPIFIRQGAIIPMDVTTNHTGHGTAESAGSLTVLVYPHPTARTSFRYRPDAREAWVTFSSTAGEAGTLTLSTDAPVGPPVIYRIGRWDAAPSSVSVDGTTVRVNQGGSLPRATSEPAVNGLRQSGWYYDDATNRLIVKVVP